MMANGGVATAAPVLPWGMTLPFFSPERAGAAMNSSEESRVKPGLEADRERVRRILGGDEDEFRGLVVEFKQRVLGTASRFARNRYELDDLGQEVFLRVWRGLKTWRGEAPLEHWVGRVTVRVCYDFLRKNRKRRESEVLVDEVRDGESAGAGDARQRERREVVELVRWGLAKLPPKDEMILTLLELEDRSVAEVSGMTGWSESNVKVRAFRARKKLKVILERVDG